MSQYESRIAGMNPSRGELAVSASTPTARALRSDGFRVRDNYVPGGPVPTFSVDSEPGGMPNPYRRNLTSRDEAGTQSEPVVTGMVLGNAPRGHAPFIANNNMLLAVGQITGRPGREPTVVSTPQHFNSVAAEKAQDFSTNMQTLPLEIEQGREYRDAFVNEGGSLSALIGRKRGRTGQPQHSAPLLYKFTNLEETAAHVIPLGYIVARNPELVTDDHRDTINYVYMVMGWTTHIPNMWGHVCVGDKVGWMVGRMRQGAGSETESIEPTNIPPIQMLPYVSSHSRAPDIFGFSAEQFSNGVRTDPTKLQYSLATRTMFREEQPNPVQGFSWDDQGDRATRCSAFYEPRFHVVALADGTRRMIMRYDVVNAVTYFTGMVQRSYNTFPIPAAPERRKMLTERTADAYHHCQAYVDLMCK